MSLKKLTDSIHRKAEQTKWAQLLVSGNMTREQYTLYLYNQSHIYAALETEIHNRRMITDPEMRKIFRVFPISRDLMGFLNYEDHTFETVKAYREYVKDLDESGLWAHMYVRHFGDMYGGQIISKKAPSKPEIQIVDSDGAEVNSFDNGSPHFYYEFENKGKLIKFIRSKLDNSMADEATVCFQFAIDLFEELEQHFDL